MFSLLYGFLEYLFKTPEYHVLMVGLDKVRVSLEAGFQPLVTQGSVQDV